VADRSVPTTITNDKYSCYLPQNLHSDAYILWRREPLLLMFIALLGATPSAPAAVSLHLIIRDNAFGSSNLRLSSDLDIHRLLLSFATLMTDFAVAERRRGSRRAQLAVAGQRVLPLGRVPGFVCAPNELVLGHVPLATRRIDRKVPALRRRDYLGRRYTSLGIFVGYNKTNDNYSAAWGWFGRRRVVVFLLWPLD
jgi:hypothetical protein